MSNAYTIPQLTDEMPRQFFEVEALQHRCHSCGAAVITDKNAASTFCVFCGSEKIVAERLVDTGKPDYVIPFKYGRTQAVEALFKWCKSGRFTPTNYVKDSNVEKLTGLYVPICLCDCNTEMNFTANASTVTYITTGGRKNSQTTKTSSFYKIVRKRKLRLEKIQIDGATRIDDQLMEDIEPYDYCVIEDFDMKYLAGFFAEKSVQSPEDIERRLNEKIKKYHECIFNNSVEKYASVLDVVEDSVLHEKETHLALLPVWILNYKYLGRTYTFAMNGQTGKIAGRPPFSILKLILLGLVLLPVVVVVCGLIGGLILGGF